MDLDNIIAILVQATLKDNISRIAWVIHAGILLLDVLNAVLRIHVDSKNGGHIEPI